MILMTDVWTGKFSETHSYLGNGVEIGDEVDTLVEVDLHTLGRVGGDEALIVRVVGHIRQLLNYTDRSDRAASIHAHELTKIMSNYA